MLVVSMMVGHFDWKHSYLIEKNVSITFILPSRWQDGAESLGIEITRCLCFGIMTYSYNSLSRKVRNLKWPFMELVIRWLNNFRMSGGSRLNMMITLMGLTMMVVLCNRNHRIHSVKSWFDKFNIVCTP